MEIITLKDDIMNEKDHKLLDKKQNIIYDLEKFLRKKLENLRSGNDSSSGDADDDDDTTCYIQDSDDSSDSNNKMNVYYKETESEYDFSEADANLRKQMKNKMNDIRKELNKNDNNDMIKITKCYTYY